MCASANSSSKSTERAFRRISTAISSYGTPSAASSLTRERTNAPSPSGESKPRSSGSGPAGRVARNVFSAPPSLGTSRLASASTSGVER